MANDLNTAEWRTAAHNVIETAALNNQYLTSDIVIAALAEAGLALSNYSALGGVFTRAAKAGLIAKAAGNPSKSHSAKTVWRSLTHQPARPLVPRTVGNTGRSQIATVLALIKRPTGATNWELSRAALKYTSVISELRKEGHNIMAERQQLKNGRASNTWLYMLLDEKALAKGGQNNG